MKKYLEERAADSESEALKSLIPGFIVQPRYKSCVEFKAPLEMRVVTLWGKARLGIWWWGRKVVGTTPAKGQKPQRTAWLVRKSNASLLANGEESWEALHEHQGDNKGFDAALQLFIRAMPAMAAAAESIAKAVGAPFLRSDFFVGSEKWGVRLNEVAYGSGVDCRRKESGSDEVVDDGPVIARILQEGFKHCQRHPPEHFMEALGAKGQTYEALEVKQLDVRSQGSRRPRLPTLAIHAFESASAQAALASPVAAGDCETCSHKREVQMRNFETKAAASAAAAKVQPGVQPRPPLISGRPLAMSPKARSVEVPVGLRPPRLLNCDAGADSCGVQVRRHHEHHQLHDPSARKMRPTPESAVLASPRVTLSANETAKKLMQMPRAHQSAVLAAPRLREEGTCRRVC
jgi:hypothetical protein